MPYPIKRILYLVSNSLVAAARILGATAFIVSVFKGKSSTYHKRKKRHDRDRY